MDTKELKQYQKMVFTPISKLIVSLSIPTVISMLTTMIYNLADAYFVGKLGTSASAAIGIVMGVQALFQAFGFMFGHGAGSIIGRKLSEGKRNEADKFLTISFFSSIIIGTIITIISFMFLDKFMVLLGSTDTILPYSRKYAFYILISGPALGASCVLNNVMRYEGRAFLSMVGLVSGGVLNIIGDPILIFGFDLGIDGAGLSTALSLYISLFILLFMFLSGKTISRIKLSSVTCLGKDKIISNFILIIKTGFPSLIRQSLNGFSTMALNRCSMPYGDAAIAAMTIAGRVMMFISSILIGIGQGFQPVSAFNFGAKKYKRLKSSYFFTLKMGVGLMAVFGIIGFIFTDNIIAIFRDDLEVINYGIPSLRCMCIGVIFAPLSVVANMLFQSIGKSKTASFLALMRSGLFYIPIIIILPIFIGFAGIQSAQMCADLLSAACSMPFVIAYFKKLPKEDEITEKDNEVKKLIVHSS